MQFRSKQIFAAVIVTSIFAMINSCGVIRCVVFIATVLCRVLIYLPRNSSCWNFTAVNLSKDVFLWKYAAWRNRAFLAIPSGDWKAEKEYEEHPATLYETVWPESNFPIISTRNVFSSMLQNKSTNNCIRSTVDLDVDSRGRLWVLEVPHKSDCFAKIIAYDLKRNDQLTISNELTNVPTKDLRSIAVDQSGSRAYIGDPGDESIIVFSFAKRRWWRIRMIHGPTIPRVFSTDIAISKRSSVLYMTGSSLDLFSINLDDLWNDKELSLHNGKSQNITVTWRGAKMGSSSGLFCDAKGGLHYFMISERASVRWDTKLPSKAESHSILLQNENYPCITDYLMDGQKNVWGLVNSRCPFTKGNASAKLQLKSRTVKIGKFSPSL